ncbi:MAG: serine hydrolase [Marinoscillum sp.]
MVFGNASILSTDDSFGHTGFTGTMIWADPSYNHIFVFLSNRIHPNSNNYQLIRRNIRTRIQDVVYEALLAKWTK